MGIGGDELNPHQKRAAAASTGGQQLKAYGLPKENLE